MKIFKVSESLSSQKSSKNEFIDWLILLSKSFTLQSGEAREMLITGELLSLHRLSITGGEKSPGLYFRIYEHHEQKNCPFYGP